MILVDTSVWVDHLRAGDEELTALLNNSQVLMHSFVPGDWPVATCITGKPC